MACPPPHVSKTGSQFVTLVGLELAVQTKLAVRDRLTLPPECFE